MYYLTVYESSLNKRRIGKINDGGYVICDLTINYDCFISAGIEYDTSFEEDFLKINNHLLCYAHDGTINTFPSDNPNILWIKKNIGANNSKETTNLHNYLERSKYVFIKMDIEGYEIEWLESLNEIHINNIAQLVIEFHNPFSEREEKMFNKLNKTHILLHFHGNNCCGTKIYQGIEVPKVFECTYVNKKYVNNIKLNTINIPSNFDYPNIPNIDEIHITHMPFVDNILYTYHDYGSNAGFFSECTYRLFKIIGYFNNYHKLPNFIDSSKHFSLYKYNGCKNDICNDFFQITNTIINYTNNIDFHPSFQTENYRYINYNILRPFINKYFLPSKECIEIINNFIKQYNIISNNTVAVYYRGTDKYTEIETTSYDLFISKMKEIYNLNKNIKFLVQSDSLEFINIISQTFNNCIIIKEIPVSTSNKGNHYENTPGQNYKTIKNFIPIVYIISKCKYVICSTSNVSLWIMLYRNNPNNIYQSYGDKWF